MLMSAPLLQVLRCSNMLTREELEDTEEREALKEDVTEECNKVRSTAL